MKKFLYILLLVPAFGIGQSTDQNYIENINYKTPVTDYVSSPDKATANTHITYFDGLGRPVQQIDGQQSNIGHDIVTHIDYDGFGRQSQEFLPFTASDDLLFIPDAAAPTEDFYTSYGDPTEVYYSQKFFEPSPLNRVRKQAAPGEAWAGTAGTDPDHAIKFDYRSNAANEVIYFSVTPLGLKNNGYYPVDRLYKTITKDENWTSGVNHTTEEFKDKQGRVILKRTYDAAEQHDTYYVYDKYGNLTYVIPPLAVSDAENLVDKLCYLYRYDTRNRLILKKLPGRQAEHIIYNKLDQPVMTGPVPDPFGGTDEGWLVTKYDAFRRVAYTAWLPVADLESDLSYFIDEYNLAAVLYESKTGSNVDDIDNVWSSAVPPASGYKLLTINYYDDYTFPGATDSPSDAVLGQNPIDTYKGMATGSWTRALTGENDTDGETSYMIYDTKGRLIRTYSKNYLGGFTQVDTSLSFTGQPLTTVTTHKRTDADEPVIVTDNYTYTPQDRLLLHTHAVDGGDAQVLAHNQYDGLGRLTTKFVGGGNPDDFVGFQKVDYAYNIRGWLKSINSPELHESGFPDDLFYFGIKYNDPEVADPLYNGNISETYWKSGSDNVLRKYNYAYDAMNRLRSARYQKPGLSAEFLRSYDEAMTYDKNGNILTMYREGTLDDALNDIVMDDLAYGYKDNTNQLMKVTDATNNPNGFKDDSNGLDDTDDDYAYDANGNLISDENKQIVSISYNHLNLPVKITFHNQDEITYLYDATGTKLKKTIHHDGSSTNLTTDYLDGFQYDMDQLAFFPHAEGYVKVTHVDDNTFFDYVFNYVDHLGNIRMSWAKDGKSSDIKILEESHYYPFGLKHSNYNMELKDFKSDGEIGDMDNPEGRPVIMPLEPDDKQLYKYKYNGKEFQDELGLNVYDYGARNYMPDLARWTTMDPLINDLDFKFDPNDVDQDDDEDVAASIETTLGNGGGIFNPDNLNPYSYGYNDPARFDDPDGKCPICIVVVAVLLYSEFANAPTGNKKTDTYNYNASKGNKTFGTKLILGGGAVKVGLNILSNSAKSNSAEKANDKTSEISKGKRVSSQDSKPSKVEKSKSEEKIGDKFTKKTEVRPSKEKPGQSRAEFVRVKNNEGKTIKTYKDSYDRANKFQGRKPLTGGPEGRTQ